ncbi:MDR family MFS transporter [Enterococcus sp. CSURQ0835]|uniref:MDR family MFS transporter n=1 Tax=Enterococcus sp. CSURQ0835 TaxID=2681394 RepID=UPI00135BF0C0|nr:MDR family MFS transporter [Enterococcus sp. CSURQ0835]
MEKKTNVKLVTVGVFIATFMTAIEGTIVTTAMPTIVGLLHGMEIMNWVFSIYLLTNAMITPIYVKLADKVGRKPVFVMGIVIFVIGSTLCGLSNSMLTLIISRGIQGVGAGAIMPVCLTIIADLYDLEKRAKVLGLNSAAWGISSVFGPLLGGFIVDAFSWHWIFFINVPIGIGLIFLMQHYFVEERRSTQHKKMDLAGSLALMLVLLSLLLGFQLLGDDGLTLKVWLLFAATLGFLVLFIKVEQTAADPVINLKLFNNRAFVLFNAVAALISGFLMGIDVYIPMWMQGVLGKSAAIGGLVLAPLSIVWMLGSFLAGRWLAKMAAKKVLLLGLVIILAGTGLILVLPQSASFWAFFLVASIWGIGYGLAMTTTTVESQNSVAPAEIGVATSFNTLSRTIGQTIMVSVFGIILNTEIARHLKTMTVKDPDIMNKLINPQTAQLIETNLRQALRGVLFSGLHTVYLSGVGLLVAGIILAYGISQKSDRL